MIVDTETPEDFSFTVNTGTPESYNEFHAMKDYLEQSEHPALVSSAYGWCKSCYTDPNDQSQKINRGGFLFMTWFQTQEAAEAFSQAMASQPFGNYDGKPMPVLTNLPPSSPNARARVMESLHTGEPWYELRYRDPLPSKAELARRCQDALTFGHIMAKQKPEFTNPVLSIMIDILWGKRGHMGEMRKEGDRDIEHDFPIKTNDL